MMRFPSSALMAIFHPQPVIVLLVGLSAIIGTTVGLSKNGQVLIDPFAPYAAILPGYMAESINAPEFTCNEIYTGPRQIFYTCLHHPPNGPFSLISVTLSAPGVIQRTAFTLPQNTLQAGDLISLWRRPQFTFIGVTAYLSWPERCITAWVKTDRRHYNHWLPVWYVVFDCN